MTRDTTQRLAVSALLADCKNALPILFMYRDQLCADMEKHIRAVEDAFGIGWGPPRLVQVGDAPAEVANYEAVQDAVSDAMLEPYLPAPNPTFTSPDRGTADK